MQHTTTVDQTTFEALKGKQRHLITPCKVTEGDPVKMNPDYQDGDSLLVTQDNSRNQMLFAIVGIQALHSRAVLLTLFAPYLTDSDLPETVG